MTTKKFQTWFAVMILIILGTSAYASPDYPSELARVVKQYPNSEVHMSAKQENEVNAAILAKGVTQRKQIFDFYRKELAGNGWKVELEMENSMMAVMNFSKDGQLLIVGLMDHKQPQHEGIMITLTLESGKKAPKKEDAAQKPQPQVDFRDNQDGTVTQLKTNLIWQQADDGQKHSWHTAVSYCTDLSLGGSADWRLPEKNELITLKKSSEFSIKPDFYWTSTDKKPGSVLAWAVSFSESGFGSKERNKATKHYVRCVRDGS